MMTVSEAPSPFALHSHKLGQKESLNSLLFIPEYAGCLQGSILRGTIIQIVLYRSTEY